jgi:hypothetical protein
MMIGGIGTLPKEEAELALSALTVVVFRLDIFAARPLTSDCIRSVLSQVEMRNI